MGVHGAVAGLFFALGLGLGLWGGASGAILTRAGVDPAAFGAILTVYTGVYLVAMSSGGALAKTAALLWSSLLLREEAPRLAAIAGLGGLFFALCQAALRFNVDVVRLSVSDRRIIVASFALAALGFALVAADAGFSTSVAGFATIGFGTGAIVPCGFALAARRSPGAPAVGLSSAPLLSTFTRLPAPLALGAIAQSFSLPVAFGAFAGVLAASGLAMAMFGPSDGGASPVRKE